MTSDHEEDLDAQLARLADGDRSAFTSVFKQLQQPIFRLCMRMLKNEADARDAAQQAMEKILERASDYDRQRSALPWAFAIAAWECRSIVRRRSRSREVVSDADADVAGETGESGEETALRRDLLDAAVHALGTLSELDRETLLATFKDEAGEVTGATFRKRRERALERLRGSFRRLYGLD